MTRYFRPNVARMAGYVPGEQPRDGGFIKLNTNENPYPPSPRVKEAIVAAVTDRLRLYPDPMATAFRQAAARLHRIEPEMILAGNGSDDVLTIVTRAFVGPGDPAAYATPSYLLYSTLIQLQDGRAVLLPYSPEWTLDLAEFAVPGLKLVYIANPDSPSGTAMPRERIAEILRTVDCPVLVDEAYGDFADSKYHSIPLLGDHPNLIVSRSFSKGYSLAGIRLGYLAASAEMVEHLVKVKDSYNCDLLSQVAGVAALEDQDYLAQTRSKVQATRKRLGDALRSLGYNVPESQSNFVWATGGPAPARETFQRLKERRILVRLMTYPGYPEGLRVSVGTDDEIDRFLEALRQVI
ncbi:MAG: histidinol-phosphate transaminase [Isosphaeraceae bacterium]